jgi:hypothetical protein
MSCAACPCTHKRSHFASIVVMYILIFLLSSAFKSDDGDGQAAAGGGAKHKKRSSIFNVISLEAFQFDAFLQI